MTETANKETQNGKKERNRKILRGVLFLLINLLVIGVFVFLEDRDGDILYAEETFDLLRRNVGYTLGAFAMYPCILLADFCAFFCLTAKIKKMPVACVTGGILGRYYDRITPWSVGGEPFQIAYFSRSGLSTADSLSVNSARHVLRFFATAVAVVPVLLFSGVVTDLWVTVAAFAGVFGGLIVPSFLLLCAFRPAVGQKISSFFIRLGAKAKIVKDVPKAEEKVRKNVGDFLSGLRYLSADKKSIAILALCAWAELLANNSVPYFVLRALGADVGFFRVFVLCLYVNYASGLAPSPGGSGLAELSFSAIFAAYIGDGLLFWAVLFWRVAIFYIPVFVGFVTQTVITVKTMTGRTKKKG